MKTHNAIIYHCLCCGKVVHSEPDARQPECCGKPMVKAAAETIVEREDDRADGAGGEGAPADLNKVRPKPR